MYIRQSTHCTDIGGIIGILPTCLINYGFGMAGIVIIIVFVDSLCLQTNENFTKFVFYRER